MYQLYKRFKKNHPILAFFCLTIAKIWATMFVIRKVIFWQG